MEGAGRQTLARTARLAGACAGLLAAACGGASGPSPGTATLPLAPRAQVIVSAAGASQVDPTHDPNHYRYMALGGPAGMTGAQLIATQVRTMVALGWNRERSIGFQGTATRAEPVPVTTPGAEVLLDSPDRREYAAMSLLLDRAAASLQTDHTPLSGSRAIGGALAARRPVLWVVLGNGTHS